MYNYRFGIDKTIKGRISDFLFGNLNCQAARNRFKLAKRELKKSILDNSYQKEIRIISLASGTSQLEIETLAKLKKHNINIKIVLIDKDYGALKRAQEFASVNNVLDQVMLMKSDVSYGLKIANKFKPHIIEMIAFLDYFAKDEAIEFISTIYKILPIGGTFIASNTVPNLEMHFVKWVVGWPLIYRKPNELAKIIRKARFDQCKVVNEPLNIQAIATAIKTEIA